MIKTKTYNLWDMLCLAWHNQQLNASIHDAVIIKPGLVTRGAFQSTKNSGLNFRKFHVPNGMIHSGCTDPTQATARLVIVLVSRMQKSGTVDNNFVKWKGTFRSETGQSRPPLKLVPNILVETNRNGPFHLIYQPNFPEFGVEWKAPKFWPSIRSLKLAFACTP